MATGAVWVAMAGFWLRSVLPSALTDAPALLLLVVVVLLVVEPPIRIGAFGMIGALEHRFKGDESTSIVASMLQQKSKLDSHGTDPLRRYRVPVSKCVRIDADFGDELRVAGTL